MGIEVGVWWRRGLGYVGSRRRFGVLIYWFLVRIVNIFGTPLVLAWV